MAHALALRSSFYQDLIAECLSEPKLVHIQLNRTSIKLCDTDEKSTLQSFATCLYDGDGTPVSRQAYPCINYDMCKGYTRVRKTYCVTCVAKGQNRISLDNDTILETDDSDTY